MSKHRKIELTSEQRTELEKLIRSGQTPARTQTRARILLLSDQGENTYHSAEQIADALSCLYERFAPEEARRIAAKLEWHDTPEHGSWLNMAKCELSVLAKQCLKRRIPDADTLKSEVAAWQLKRNSAQAKISWYFTTADAHIKLKRLYPVIKVQEPPN